MIICLQKSFFIIETAFRGWKKAAQKCLQSVGSGGGMKKQKVSGKVSRGFAISLDYIHPKLTFLICSRCVWISSARERIPEWLLWKIYFTFDSEWQGFDVRRALRRLKKYFQRWNESAAAQMRTH
jgi:hypothetical protein